MMEMTPEERRFFSWILLAIGVTAVLCNSLLIRLARRIPQRSTELRFAVMLASIDMAIPTLAIGTSLLANWHADGLERLQALCQVKGPIDFLLQYLSLLIVAIIAMERFSKVRGTQIPAMVWNLVIVYTTVYFTLVLMTALSNEFYTSPSGCDCAPVAKTSFLSALVIFGLGFSMFLSLAITLYCYTGILGYVRETGAKLNTTRISRSVLVRVISTCVIYLLLVSPSSILIMMEATHNSAILDKLSLAISILVAIIAVANPCLVLFAHSLIFEQLRLSLQSWYPPSSDSISLHSYA
ncbi:hypothetical protein DSO57_1027217 [Entomophthora muscae]|uniref:Uncharacterized protein n=1 Tax=Entomophthora muscae TaxID=34485 RepID=A0ACC2UM91_9FUNG|nr:hypothetical protein DSO57_1027217 [Entomophthora muscae]